MGRCLIQFIAGDSFLFSDDIHSQRKKLLENSVLPFVLQGGHQDAHCVRQYDPLKGTVTLTVWPQLLSENTSEVLWPPCKVPHRTQPFPPDPGATDIVGQPLSFNPVPFSFL